MCAYSSATVSTHVAPVAPCRLVVNTWNDARAWADSHQKICDVSPMCSLQCYVHAVFLDDAPIAAAVASLPKLSVLRGQQASYGEGYDLHGGLLAADTSILLAPLLRMRAMGLSSLLSLP